MKRIYNLLSILILSAGLMSCGPGYIKPVEASQKDFAVSFFKHVNQDTHKGENLVLSPYSAAVALSMLAEGAEGETRVEFDDVLGGIIYQAEDLGGNDTVIVKSANSVWVDDDFSLRNRYVSLLERDFDAFITTQNFADPATVKAINNWCSEHTAGKINEVIDRLEPGMVMVLANALYFNAPWENSFNAELTSQKPFHGVSVTRNVPFMFKRSFYDYAEYHGVQMVRLPYAGGRYSMFVFLPPAGADMDALLSEVDGDMLDASLGLFSSREVVLSLPKFKNETSVLLNKPLKDMGIRTAFTQAADFSGIAEMGPLVLDQVKQKCFLELSEEGTEAAAVTVAQVRLTSARPDRTPAVMTVDRPFVFMIADSQMEDILFAGKIVNL